MPVPHLAHARTLGQDERENLYSLPLLTTLAIGREHGVKSSTDDARNNTRARRALPGNLQQSDALFTHLTQQPCQRRLYEDGMRCLASWYDNAWLGEPSHLGLQTGLHTCPLGAGEVRGSQ